MTSAAERIAAALGIAPRSLRPLSGGSVAEVYELTMPDGARLVAKVGRSGAKLDLEGWMLRYLRGHAAAPVPAVVHESDVLLVMECLPNAGGISPAVECAAADVIAALHAVRGPSFGLERDTLIGGLHQPNPPTASWLAFFRDYRLRFMAADAERAGRLPAALLGRIDRLAAKLGDWIGEPSHPSLIHGDLWTGNVLAHQGRLSGLIDPAIYYADPEIELAFTTLFGTFGDAFFGRYGELRPLAPGFFEERRDLYNLYPLLVHVRLFGGSYVADVDRTLRRYGC